MEFINSGADEADAATYQNVVNCPLLNQADDVLIIHNMHSVAKIFHMKFAATDSQPVQN